MKRIVLFLLLVALAGLAACSSTPQVTRTDDLERVTAVERAASFTGAKIYWINPPQKTQRAN